MEQWRGSSTYAGAVVHMSMVHSVSIVWMEILCHSRYYFPTTNMAGNWSRSASLDGREVRTYSIDSYMATLKFENGLYSFLCAWRRKLWMICIDSDAFGIQIWFGSFVQYLRIQNLELVARPRSFLAGGTNILAGTEFAVNFMTWPWPNKNNRRQRQRSAAAVPVVGVSGSNSINSYGIWESQANQRG